MPLHIYRTVLRPVGITIYSIASLNTVVGGFFCYFKELTARIFDDLRIEFRQQKDQSLFLKGGRASKVVSALNSRNLGNKLYMLYQYKKT